MILATVTQREGRRETKPRKPIGPKTATPSARALRDRRTHEARYRRWLEAQEAEAERRHAARVVNTKRWAEAVMRHQARIAAGHVVEPAPAYMRAMLTSDTPIQL